MWVPREQFLKIHDYGTYILILEEQILFKWKCKYPHGSADNILYEAATLRRYGGCLFSLKALRFKFMFLKKIKLFCSNKTGFPELSCGSPLGEHCFTVYKLPAEAFCKLCELPNQNV